MTTPTAPTAHAPIDLVGLHELTDGDAEFAADLVQSYTDNSRELLTKIRESHARGDRLQLARAVHQLAGASANVHAMALRDLCSSLERAAEGATAAQLDQHVAQVAAELARVADALMNMVGRHEFGGT